MGKKRIKEKTVDAPVVSLSEGQAPVDLLLNFYRALSWDGEMNLDPTKVRITKEVYYSLCDQIKLLCTEQDISDGQVGFYMVSCGPGVDDDIPPGKVRLYKGWVTTDTVLPESA